MRYADVARRPLLRMLHTARTRLTGAPEPAEGPGTVRTLLGPLLTLLRGLRRIVLAARRLWARTPRQRRGPLLLLVCGAAGALTLVPRGVPLAALTLAAAALGLGRTPHHREPEKPADEPRTQRLRTLYEALVPCFAPPPGSPVAPEAGPQGPLYAHGGDWEQVFRDDAFDADGRLARLVIRYPAYFTDDDPAARARVERVVHARSGRGREYRFAWDEELGELTVSVLSPLPFGLPARRFATAPGEAVLGYTDPVTDRWSLPAVDDGAEAPPAVVWRTDHGGQPHLLAVGGCGSGTSTLLHSLALQALGHGDVLIADGRGTGAYASLAGRDGVLAVESDLDGVLAGLAWAARETGRRLAVAARARRYGQPLPPDTGRPLWLLVDRPARLADQAAAEGRRDPVALLEVPLRQGRAAQVTVVVAEEFEGLPRIPAELRQQLHARVVLGRAPAERIEEALGAPPGTTPPARVPPGRGYARLGAGPVLRLQVPAPPAGTPDPCDGTAYTGDTSHAR